MKEQQLEGWGNSYGKGGQIYAYGKVGDAAVATRPDAACYHCLQITQDEWQRYRACAEVCVVADCVAVRGEKRGLQLWPNDSRACDQDVHAPM